MGNCNFHRNAGSNNEDTSITTISIENFNLLYVIGKGGFGKVWRVQNKKTKELFALKQMSKRKVISKRSVSSVMNELELLSSLRHPFLINMVCAFQDRSKLFLVMDLLSGGDLRSHLSRNRTFSEAQTKFFAACILVGLEYLHQNGVLHRDIKPENIVFDSKGYLRITDLGIARVWKPENSADTSGTPGYMAPEVMCRRNHGVSVDYYALGIIIFECMYGRRPYSGISRQEIRDQILANQVQLKKDDVPKGWSLEAADFVNRLIQRKPENRLGLHGPEAVKEHVWFRDFPWQRISAKELESPYVPSPFQDDIGHFPSANQKDSSYDAIEAVEMIAGHTSSMQTNLFAGYNFDNTGAQPNYGLANNQNISNRFNKTASKAQETIDTRSSKNSKLAETTTASSQTQTQQQQEQQGMLLANQQQQSAQLMQQLKAIRATYS